MGLSEVVVAANVMEQVLHMDSGILNLLNKTWRNCNLLQMPSFPVCVTDAGDVQHYTRRGVGTTCMIRMYYTLTESAMP